MWEDEQSFLWFVNIFFFYIYVKEALTLHERWPESKQSEKKRNSCSHHPQVYATCNCQTFFLLYKLHLFFTKKNISCAQNLCWTKKKKKLLHFLNYSPSPSVTWRPLPIKKKKKGFQMTFLYQYVLPCVLLLFAARSKLLWRCLFTVHQLRYMH